jgi:hypothetical protein
MKNTRNDEMNWEYTSNNSALTLLSFECNFLIITIFFDSDSNYESNIVTCLTWLLIYTMRRAAGSVIGLL